MNNQPPTDADQLAQMRYMAVLNRRSAPPRCNPISILVLVMSLGMAFIGLTMTIIAHWPGSTSFGENPLKIAGPILLSVGVALFIGGLFLAYYLNSRERKRWAKSVNNMAQVTLDQSASSLPGAKGVPKDGAQGRPIAGSSFETGYRPPPEKLTSDSFDTQRNASYSYAENSTDYGKKPSLMQSAVDSYGATTQGAQYSAGDADEQSIPDPIRTRKKKNLNSSNENLNAAEREELLSMKPVRHEDFSQSEEEVFNLSAEGGANVPAAIRKKKKKTTKSSRENLNMSENEELLNSSSSYRKESKVTEESRSSYSMSKEHQSSYGGEVVTGISSKPAPPSKKPKPAVPSKPSKQSQQQPPSPSLRVHVRTQPGATVRIHPGSATPPPAYDVLNKSTGSAETDL